jgi:hypothetical protein
MASMWKDALIILISVCLLFGVLDVLQLLLYQAKVIYDLNFYY